jgi:hypothetical protein
MLAATSDTVVICVTAIIVAALLIPVVAAWKYAAKHEHDPSDSLVEEAVAAQQRVADELSQLNARVAEVERLLKEVG